MNSLQNASKDASVYQSHSRGSKVLKAGALGAVGGAAVGVGGDVVYEEYEEYVEGEEAVDDDVFEAGDCVPSHVSAAVFYDALPGIYGIHPVLAREVGEEIYEAEEGDEVYEQYDP